MRVLIDTNVLISAALIADSIPWQAYQIRYRQSGHYDTERYQSGCLAEIVV